MRTSRVEAAGGGTVRANLPLGVGAFKSLENYKPQQLARHLCRSCRGRVKHAKSSTASLAIRLRLLPLGDLRLVTWPRGAETSEENPPPS